MIEGQLGQFFDKPPLRLCSIISTLHWELVDDSVICNGNHSLPRIAVNSGIDAQLLHMAYYQTRLFPQLSQSTLFRRFIHIHKTAGKSPTTFVGFIAALNQQNFKLLSDTAEQHTVCSQRRMRITI